MITLLMIAYLCRGFFGMAFILAAMFFFIIGFVPGWLVSAVIVYVLISPFFKRSS